MCDYLRKYWLVALIALVLALFAMVFGRYFYLKSSAIHAIERSGGHILYDFHDIAFDSIGQSSFTIRQNGTIANEIREDSFHRWMPFPLLASPQVVSLSTADPQLLRSIEGFSSLKRFQIFWENDDPKLTSKHFLFLEHHKELRYLLLGVIGGPDDDKFLSRIKNWPNLKWFTFGGSDISDTGLAHCVDHPSLVVLGVNGKEITDRAVDYLKRIPKLRMLMIGSNATISESALQELLRSKPSLKLWVGGRSVLSKTVDSESRQDGGA